MESVRRVAKRAINRDEDAPLLADGTAVDEESMDNRNPSGGSEDQSRLQRAWRWLKSHLVVIFLVLLLIGGAIALIVYFSVLNKEESEASEDSPAICLTPSCVLASSELLHNISPRYHDIDPCTNFDQYVCEGFDATHDLRPDQGSMFEGTLMAEAGQQILRHLLEAPYSEMEALMTMSSADRNIFDKLQDTYGACLDEDEVKQAAGAPLIALLQGIQARFPAKSQIVLTGEFPKLRTQQQLGIASEDESLLTEVVTYLAKIGVTTFIDAGVGADDRDPDIVVPSINAPSSPGLPSKEYYKDPEIVAKYGMTIGLVLEALLEEANATSASETPMFFTQSAQLVERIINFESKLARATPATEEAEDVTFYYNPLTFEEISALLPQLSVEHFIKTLAPHAPKPSKLIVGAPAYLQTLASVLKETSAETLQAYFVWKTVQQYAYKIEDDAVKPLKRFNNELQGKDPDATPERWRTCVQVADRSLGWILSRFFVQKTFSEEARVFGDKIVSDIKEQFIHKLHSAEWMTEEVRELGIQKVHAIVQKIGYPIRSPDIRNASELQAYYAPVNISSSTYFDNSLSIAQFDTKREWSALGKPTNRDEWGMTADTVNAYYNPPGNEIVFPAGIMQKPVFYDPSVPQYLTYGAFGSVSGHELSHAFDSTGRHYDEKGNYTDWWNNATVEAFKEKAQCFIDQYGEFKVPNPHGNDLHVNGRLTLGENIADAGGLNAAFKAWKATEAKKESQLLPGLQTFSKEQLFFVSYANWWCGKSRPETAVELVYRDPHAPTWARILGTMANSRDFKEAFNCPVKEPTCELW